MSLVTEPTSLLSDQILTLFDIDVGFGSSKDFYTPVATGRVAPDASFLGKLLVGTLCAEVFSGDSSSSAVWSGGIFCFNCVFNLLT
jgi:hypothetical protein